MTKKYVTLYLDINLFSHDVTGFKLLSAFKC